MIPMSLLDRYVEERNGHDDECRYFEEYQEASTWAEGAGDFCTKSGAGLVVLST